MTPSVFSNSMAKVGEILFIKIYSVISYPSIMIFDGEWKFCPHIRVAYNFFTWLDVGGSIQNCLTRQAIARLHVVG